MGRYVELCDRVLREMAEKGYDISPDLLRQKPPEGDLCRNENGLMSYPENNVNASNIKSLEDKEGLMSLMSYNEVGRNVLKDYTKTKKHNNINGKVEKYRGPEADRGRAYDINDISVTNPFWKAYRAFVKSDRNKALNHRYVQAVVDARQFLADFGPQAEALGWRADELFGLDDAAPLARYDRMGLVWMIDGNPVVAITDIAATIRMPAGNLLKFYRRPEGQL